MLGPSPDGVPMSGRRSDRQDEPCAFIFQPRSRPEGPRPRHPPRYRPPCDAAVLPPHCRQGAAIV